MEDKTIQIPGWKIVRTIGQGGFGKVYEVEKDDEFGGVAHSALKVISIPESADALEQYREDGYDDAALTTLLHDRVEGLTAEFRLMSRLKGCSNIVSYEDHTVVRHKDDPGYDVLIRMELLTSLPKYLERHEGLRCSEVTVKKLGMDMCCALERCARHNIIHRDIKPQNIFINEEGDFKLGDFGVARQLEKTASFMSKKGTYNYMAPEVYKGEEYGATCDIYSLGLVMYRLLNNGRLPFLPPAPAPISSEDRELAIIRRMKGEAFAAPCSADPELSRIVLKACAFDIQQRYGSAEKMYQDLFLYNVHRQQTARTAQSKADTSFSNRIRTLKKSSEPVQTAPEHEPQEPGPQKSTLQLTRATGWDSEPQEEPRSEEPGLQKEDALRAVQEQPKPQQEEVPMNTGSSSDEVAELKRLIGYFSQKSKRYKEYDELAAGLSEKPKDNRLFLILGIAWIQFSKASAFFCSFPAWDFSCTILSGEAGTTKLIGKRSDALTRRRRNCMRITKPADRALLHRNTPIPQRCGRSFLQFCREPRTIRMRRSHR